MSRGIRGCLVLGLVWIGSAGTGAPAAVADAPGQMLRSAQSLPALAGMAARPVTTDWLVTPVRRHASIYRGANDREIVLDNGLVRRTFRIAPNGATVGFDNRMTGASIIRGVKPEATLSLDGHEFAVGGLTGQPEFAYLLPQWIDSLKSDPAAFQCVGFEVGKTEARFPWKRQRHCADRPWPPPGVSVTFHYVAPGESYRGLRVAVHYELYDGLPLLSKWLTIQNDTGRPVTLDRFTGEILAAVEAESVVDERPTNTWRLPPILITSDYSFHGMDTTTAGRTTEWLPDPQYTSQVNYERRTPALAVSRPPIGPDVRLEPGDRFESFRTFELVYDGDSRERQGLAVRRMYRALAPWVTENPIMMHVRNSDSKHFRLAVDQCAAVGFEMIIYTFGSGLDMENEDPAYLARIKADIDYAHAKGIEVGAYSLLASRRVDAADDVISPKTGRPDDGAIFGNSPCLCSRWGENYFRKLRHFIETTGLDLLEHDGSYPGDVCASTLHPGHRGLEDSQWKQWQAITKFYQWCRARGVYLNVPDFYFLSGSNKTAMGYRESDWSLPRERQIILGRQNIFDGTWGKTPSMGWMFVPLVEYQGGGAAATLEPLRAHLDAYAAHLANNFGAGVQACYRGPRLYDSPETEAVVRKWVSWFKDYRAILESDVIHLRRADGRDLDGLLHVNPGLRPRGLAMLYNPLDHPVRETVKLPLYYTGLTHRARIRQEHGPWKRFKLDREFNVSVPVSVPANGRTWLVVEKP
ncbi:MAG: alpha-galactosidase [Verrucomicrobia bacterium]|nr:alpha-galactosidase [Verrucomicrobiota bacterium]